MQMEFEGYIQQQPTYSHVGYLSAAVNHSVLDQNHMGIGLSLCITLVLTVAAMSLHRQARSGWSRAVFVVLAVGAGVFAVHSAYALIVPTWRIDPRLEQTLYSIEAVAARTEAWATAHGRVPTSEEWTAAFNIPETRDGWGRRFEYEVVDEPNLHDGQMYLLRVCDDTRRDLLSGRNLVSSDAGADGLFGTSDDRFTPELSILDYRKVNLARLQHGRAARDPLPELPNPWRRKKR